MSACKSVQSTLPKPGDGLTDTTDTTAPRFLHCSQSLLPSARKSKASLPLVARGNQDGWTAEVTRVAVLEDVPNACSMLYGACWRAARAMGYRRLITYTLQSEPGTSLRAAGWKVIGQVKGRSWNTPTRPRVDKHPLEDKTLWEAQR